jgi:hypothetical protein
MGDFTVTRFTGRAFARVRLNSFCSITSMLVALVSWSQAQATLPTDPVHDQNFLILPDGRDLASVNVSGVPLSLSHGGGAAFGDAQKAAYLKLKIASQTTANYPVQWVLMDLDKHLVVEQSLTPAFKIFGASDAKIFAGGTLVDKQNGLVTKDQLQIMANMLVVSSNTAWMEIQKEAGNGNDDKGREANYLFTQRMGYKNTRGFQGAWNNMHGNELNAKEITDYLYDMYHGNFKGAEFVWKLMHTCRTGAARGRKYLPASLVVGGKTGSYDGTSIDPQTGSSNGADGKPFKVAIHNHVIVFNADGHEYALAMLANSGTDESTALLAGGLFREHTSYSGH